MEESYGRIIFYIDNYYRIIILIDIIENQLQFLLKCFDVKYRKIRNT